MVGMIFLNITSYMKARRYVFFNISMISLHVGEDIAVLRGFALLLCSVTELTQSCCVK